MKTKNNRPDIIKNIKRTWAYLNVTRWDSSESEQHGEMLRRMSPEFGEDSMAQGDTS